MSILVGFLQFVLVIVCILLVGVILLQRNKGAGAGVTFGGGEAVFGADMGNVLTRSTIVLGFLFVAITLALSIINAHGRKTGPTSVTDGVAPVKAVQEMPAQPVAEPEDIAPAAVSDELADAAAESADAAEDIAPAEAPAEAPAAEEPAPAEAPAEAPAAEPAEAAGAPAEAAEG